ncbi:hypothetical protein [Bradyrhizobium sp.]|uniref:hypothetical protein n=1 Tax=Bradyrhizobium sp. TaxID=376 RepID=UPI003C74ABE3
MLHRPKQSIQLSTYNIEKKGKHFYYWRTPFFCLEAEHKGPYSSLSSVCLMIAREMLQEALAMFKMR